MSPNGAGFDRMRPRTAPGVEPESPAGVIRPVSAAPRPRDSEGKVALFSAAEQQRASRASVSITCSRCDAETVVSPFRAVRLLVPSLHMFGLRRYPSWLRCPACRHHTWVRLGVHL
jgi:uncharacterized protein with PIN domain